MSKSGFDKFINKKETGSKKKERIRQEKKQVRAEKNAYFDEQKRLARERRNPTGKAKSEPFAAKGDKPKSGFKKQSGPAKPGKQFTSSADTRKPQTGFVKKKSDAFVEKKAHKPGNITIQRTAQQVPLVKAKADNTKNSTQATEGEMPLNKFIAWSGVCARRDAADLVKAGKVTVNGKLVTEPPFRVSQTDNIKVNGKKISIQKNLVYILLNKPKDYITTTDDPEGRKTVMDLVKKATTERVFPVGRLDRNTTGVLLLTNDGEVAQRLTHPKYEVKKIYEVRLDKPVTKQQLDIIASGIKLDDGFIQPDSIAYADATDKSVIGIEIHSGRNRIVRRIFEHLGFDVRNLDRVMYGIFTKKNVDRGKWRFLSEKEIRLLKHLNTSFSNKKSQHK